MRIHIPVQGSRTTVEFEDVTDTLYRLTINSHSGRFVEVDKDGNGVVSVVLNKEDVKRLAKAS